jgi:hypothetical protein
MVRSRVNPEGFKGLRSRCNHWATVLRMHYPPFKTLVQIGIKDERSIIFKFSLRIPIQSWFITREIYQLEATMKRLD